MLTMTGGSSATITYTCTYLLKVNSIIKKVPNRFPSHLYFSLDFYLIVKQMN